MKERFYLATMTQKHWMASQQAVDYAECQQHAMVFSGYNPAAPQTSIKHRGIG